MALPAGRRQNCCRWRSCRHCYCCCYPQNHRPTARSRCHRTSWTFHPQWRRHVKMHWLHCLRHVGSCAVAAAIVRHCRAGLRAWDPNWCAYCGFQLLYTARKRGVCFVFDLFCIRGRNTCLTIAQELILCHNQIYDIRIFNTRIFLFISFHVYVSFARFRFRLTISVLRV